MSSFYSSSAKVVPECLSSSPSHAPKKSMDSSSSPDLLLKPLDNLSAPDNDLIKPMILTFDKKIRLNPGLISDDYDKNQPASASPDGEAELWPKRTEFDDRPSSPYYEDAATQASEPAYLFPKQSELDIDRPTSQSEKAQVTQTELHDRPSSPHSFKSAEKVQGISEPAYQTEQGNQSSSSPYQTEQGNRPLSPPYQTAIKHRMQVIRETDYKAQHKAEEGVDKPKMQRIREGAHIQGGDEKPLEMKESYRSSARGRLSRVVEESESFSRREFGANVLNYMSTHSSANHAANLSNLSSYKHPSYHHNNHSNLSYTHSSYKPAAGNFMTSKSAPAGFALRTRSAFALFRRGTSEGGAQLGTGGRVVYRRTKSRKPKSLGHTLLWPLLKIRNGYVGCMMGLEGTGDLSGMAQGGTYATRARYFADVPLSKSDSRNFG